MNPHLGLRHWRLARRPWLAPLAAAVLLLPAGPAAARTILLEIEDLDQAAAIHAEAPRLSWAARRHTPHLSPAPAYDSFITARVDLTDQSALLMRFDLERIPADQRIVHAELVVPVTGMAGNDPRFYLWRTLAGWGAGVSHRHRRVRFDDEGKRQTEQWTKPGARAIGSDRAPRPTDVVRVTEDAASEAVINVTEDVELWYDGRAANHGWLFTVEEPETRVGLASPLYEHRERWTLRVTYEPQPE